MTSTGMDEDEAALQCLERLDNVTLLGAIWAAGGIAEADEAVAEEIESAILDLADHPDKWRDERRRRSLGH